MPAGLAVVSEVQSAVELNRVTGDLQGDGRLHVRGVGAVSLVGLQVVIQSTESGVAGYPEQFGALGLGERRADTVVDDMQVIPMLVVGFLVSDVPSAGSQFGQVTSEHPVAGLTLADLHRPHQSPLGAPSPRSSGQRGQQPGHPPMLFPDRMP